jgi:hypothetical protein
VSPWHKRSGHKCHGQVIPAGKSDWNQKTAWKINRLSDDVCLLCKTIFYVLPQSLYEDPLRVEATANRLSSETKNLVTSHGFYSTRIEAHVYCFHKILLRWSVAPLKFIWRVWEMDIKDANIFPIIDGRLFSSSETSVHTGSTGPHIPEDGILRSHHRENLKSYLILIVYSFTSHFRKLHDTYTV